jgi:hypothetical protein
MKEISNTVQSVFERSRDFADKVDWVYISSKQKLSEGFIREFQDKVSWNYISYYQDLSEEFIREFADKVDWNYISYYQKLSENFIIEFQDYVNWQNISRCQKLSEEFIKKFKTKINFNYVLKYQKLSEEFVINLLNDNIFTLDMINNFYLHIENDDSYSDEFCSFIYNYLQKGENKNKLIDVFRGKKNGTKNV